MLIVTSLVFYGWLDWHFPFLLLFSAAVCFCCGNTIAAVHSANWRKVWLVVTLVINLGILCYLKYANFFISSFVSVANLVGWHISPVAAHVLLPVGISFFTFQSLTYPLDIYLGRTKETVSLITFITYVTFLPKLFAGPIARASEFSIALSRKRNFILEDLEAGCVRIITGYFKKAVVADNLALYLVNPVIADPGAYSTATVWVATFGFAIQIYADFSGYSNMAIGSAWILGLRIPENFSYPYLAINFSDFWRRWHITMSNFFRDYVYIPLGGNRKGPIHTTLNLMATMVLCGLWHGPSWTFVAWGVLHGLFLVTDRWFGSKEKSVQWLFSASKKRGFLLFFRWCYTQIMVCFAWIPFASASLWVAAIHIKALLGSSGERTVALTLPVLFCFSAILLDHFYGWLVTSRPGIEGRYVTLQAAAYVLIIALSYQLAPERPSPFMYFQF